MNGLQAYMFGVIAVLACLAIATGMHQIPDLTSLVAQTAEHKVAPVASQELLRDDETTSTSVDSTANSETSNLAVNPGTNLIDKRPSIIFTNDGVPTNYMKGISTVYYDWQEIPGADIDTFHLVPTAWNFFGYAKDKNTVYWNGKRLPDADPATFNFFTSVNRISESYSKDASHVYLNNNAILGADPRAIVGLEGYAKDKDFVYCGGQKIPGADPATFSIILAVYDDTVQNYVARYAKDAMHVFNQCYQVDSAEPSHFVVFRFDNGKPSGYAKDSIHVYFMDKILAGADASSFTMTAGTNYNAKDKNHNYYQGQIVASNDVVDKNGNSSDYAIKQGIVTFAGQRIGADPSTFVVISDANGNATRYAKDSEKVYMSGALLSNDVDPHSFVLLFNKNGTASGYSKDGKKAYYDFPQFGGQFYRPSNLVDADSTTFVLLPPTRSSVSGFAIDKNHLYFNGEAVSGADPFTFADIESPRKYPTAYFKDIRHVYYISAALSDDRTFITEILTQLTSADAPTFKVIFPSPNTLWSDIAQDKNNLYYHGKLVTSIDSDSFTLIEDDGGHFSGYAKDSSHVFYINQLSSTTPMQLQGVHPNTFTVLPAVQECNPDLTGTCFFDSQDGTHTYYKGQLIQ